MSLYLSNLIIISFGLFYFTNAFNDTLNMSKTFNYFAYGSNLLSTRIHINNPSARRIGAGKLSDYRLDFITYSTRWKGASATIVSHKNKTVWGSVWAIDNEDLPNLDKQEGVHANIYKPLEVDIELLNSTLVKCRVYIQTNVPEYVEDVKKLPTERYPSQVYMNTILRGAAESGIPDEYVKFLEKIPHNNFSGDPQLKLELNIVD